MRCAGGLNGPEAHETADAMLGMDDDRAFVEARDLGDKIRAALAPLGAPHHPVAENILLADNSDVAGLEAAFEAEHGRPRLARLQLAKCCKTVDGHDIAETVLG